MLEFLRAAVGSWVAKIFIVILIAGFAIWGIAGDVLTTNSSSAVISAGKSKVSIVDFRRQYDRIVDVFSAQFGRRLTRQEAQSFNLESSLVSQLRAEAIMEEQARLINIGQSAQQVASEIARNTEYHDLTGKFSKSRLTQILRSTGKSEAQFLRDEEAKIKREQLSRGLFADIAAPNAFIEASKLYLGEKRTVDIITLNKEDAGEILAPSDEQLKTYFDAHAGQYRSPEYRKITYVSLSPKTIADESTVTDEQIAQEYEAAGSKYKTAEKRRIEQLSFKTKEAAEAALEKLNSGTLFEELMKELKITAEDADLGIFTKKSVPDQKLAEAAFALTLNNPSKIIEGTFGPVILRVSEIVAQTITPLEEVKSEIKKELAVRLASDQIENIYNAFEDARAGGATLTEAASKLKLTPVTIESVDAQGLDKAGNEIKDLPAKDAFLSEAFKTAVGDEASPVDIDLGAYAFFEVNAIEEARNRTLDEVKDKVLQAWTDQEIRTRLDKKLAEFEKALQEGKSLAQLKDDVRNIGPFLRTDDLETLSAEGVLQAFSKKKDESFSLDTADGIGRILGVVKAVERAQSDEVKVTDRQVEQLKTQIRNELFAETLEQFNKTIKVKVNQANINAALNL